MARKKQETTVGRDAADMRINAEERRENRDNKKDADGPLSGR